MDTLDRFDEAYAKFCEQMAWITGGLLMGVSMIYVAANVFLRYVFHSGALGMTTYVAAMLVPMTYLAVPYAWISASFVTVDIVTNKLKKPVLYWFKLVFMFLNLFFFIGLLTWGSFQDTLHAYVTGKLAGEAGYFSPVWPWKATIVIGLVLTGVRLVVDIIQSIRKKQILVR